MTSKPAFTIDPDTTWLDLFPSPYPSTYPSLSNLPQPQPISTTFPIPPSKTQISTSTLTQRLTALKSVLDALKPTIALRQHLIALSRANPDFHPRHPANKAWRAKADSHARIHAAVQREIARAEESEGGAEGVTQHRLERWEGLVEMLRAWDRNESERVDELGLCEKGPLARVEGIVKDGWSFEEAWGKKEGEVARDEGDDEGVDPLDDGSVNPNEDADGRYADWYAGFALTGSRFE